MGNLLNRRRGFALLNSDEEVRLVARPHPLQFQAIILRAIQIGLTTVTQGREEIARCFNDEKESSPDEYLNYLLRKLCTKSTSIAPDSKEADAFVENLITVCFPLSNLLIEMRDYDVSENLIEQLSEFFGGSLEYQDVQNEASEVGQNNFYYSVFEWCMNFIMSPLLGNSSSHVVNRIIDNLKRLIETQEFRGYLSQAMHQNPVKKVLFSEQLAYLFSLRDESLITKVYLLFWGAPQLPGTLEDIPVQSNEVDVHKTVLAVVAGVIELINHLLCKKLRPFGFLCTLNHSLTQRAKVPDFFESHIAYYKDKLSSAHEVDLGIAKARQRYAPDSLIKRRYQLEGLKAEICFLLQYKEWLHREIRAEEEFLTDALSQISTSCEKLRVKAQEISVLPAPNDIRLMWAGLSKVDIPNEMLCSLSCQIMTTPVRYQYPESEAYDTEHVYELESLKRAFESHQRHPHRRFLARIEDFKSDEALKTKIERFVQEQIVSRQDHRSFSPS